MDAVELAKRKARYRVLVRKADALARLQFLDRAQAAHTAAEAFRAAWLPNLCPENALNVPLYR